MSLGDWAANVGIQTSDCYQLATATGAGAGADDDGGGDVYAITNRDLPQESPVLIVPNNVILTGIGAREELGADAHSAERTLSNFYSSEHVWQFYLFLKILKEYELGDQSPWYAWLNSLPRYFSNGASMTDFCYGCLPPYAAGVALAERTRMNLYVEVLDEISSIISPGSKGNEDLTKWAFSVVNTRCMQMPNGDYCIVPMADYFNHGGSYEVDVSISYDDEGSCYAYSARDVPAGSPLRMCYGDSTNPSKLLAKYGFLDDSSTATYCKYIVDGPSPEVTNMGYPDRMLFYNDGGISDEVWDVILYQELGKVASTDEQQAFYQAHMSGDEATKQAYHQQYFPRTLGELQKHVDFLVNELDELEVGIEMQMKRGKDATRHPRLPLLERHNDHVKNILELVQQNLDSMG